MEQQRYHFSLAKHRFSRFLIPLGLIVAVTAYSYCFFIENPTSNTFAATTEAHNGGDAASNDPPRVDHFEDGRLVLANIHSVDNFEVVFTFPPQEGISDSNFDIKVDVPLRHGITLAPGNIGYYLVRINMVEWNHVQQPDGSFIKVAPTIDPETDLLAHGN